jgi:hypothetical protein
MAPIDDPKYDIFYTEPEDKDTSGSWDLIKTPLEALDNNGDIRFDIPASSIYWMDLSNAHINYEARIITATGASAPAGEKFVFINNAAHSLFSDFKVKINESVVAGGDGNYHMLAYMHNHLQYTHAVKSTVKITEGYYPPSVDSKREEFTSFDHSSNKALASMMEKSKWVKFTLPLRTVSIMNQDKALPPGKKVHIILTRNDPKFAIFAADGTKNYQFEIRNMNINIPMIRPTHSIQAQIAEKSRTTPASFYYPDLRMFRYTIPKGTPQKDFFNVFQDRPIKMAIFALIKSSVYNNQGARKFIFERHGLHELELRTQGHYVSGKALTASCVSEAFRHFNRQFNLYANNEDVGINLDEYDKCSNIWPFDCTLGGNLEARQGSVESKRLYDLGLKFSTSTTDNLDILCFFVEDKRFVLGPGNEVISSDYAK